jgi:hypothetical protein
MNPSLAAGARLVLGAVLLTATAACVTPGRLGRAARAVRETPAPATPSWVGTWELVGDNFPGVGGSPDSRRWATLVVARRDTAHVVSVDGPPGQLVDYRLDGDSARFSWDFLTSERDDRRVMSVRLRAAGDSLAGEWAIGPLSGPVRGRRR